MGVAAAAAAAANCVPAWVGNQRSRALERGAVRSFGSWPHVGQLCRAGWCVGICVPAGWQRCVAHSWLRHFAAAADTELLSCGSRAEHGRGLLQLLWSPYGGPGPGHGPGPGMVDPTHHAATALCKPPTLDGMIPSGRLRSAHLMAHLIGSYTHSHGSGPHQRASNIKAKQ